MKEHKGTKNRSGARRTGGEDRRKSGSSYGKSGGRSSRQSSGSEGRGRRSYSADGEERRYSRRPDSRSASGGQDRRRTYGERGAGRDGRYRQNDNESYASQKRYTFKKEKLRYTGWKDREPVQEEPVLTEVIEAAEPVAEAGEQKRTLHQEKRKAAKDVIYGRNPVMEALRAGREMEKIMVQIGSGGPAHQIMQLAKESGVIVERVAKAALDRITAGGSHQGVAAIVSAHTYAELEDVFALAESRGEEPFLIVLDGIEDPHNLGAVIRTAECAGAHGVIIQKRRAAGLTETAVKTSAGAVEYVPCVRVTNMVRTLAELKERGVWVFACDMDGETYSKASLTGPCALVIGAEGSGISRSVKEECDRVVSIPLRGQITSLNASNAAAVLMYEIRRQRDAAEAE